MPRAKKSSTQRRSKSMPSRGAEEMDILKVGGTKGRRTTKTAQTSPRMGGSTKRGSTARKSSAAAKRSSGRSKTTAGKKGGARGGRRSSKNA